MQRIIRAVHVAAHLACAAALCFPSLVAAQTAVLTHRYDTLRTGQNLNETTLTTSSVTGNAFGKLFTRAVDGTIYAQPLYVPQLVIQGQPRNVIYVATEHNTVFAFDADDPAASAPLWQASLGTPVPSSDICDAYPADANCPYNDLTPEIGITGTPVINVPAAGGTLYVVARTKNTDDGTYHTFLHALDLVTGTEKLSGPVEIAGQVAGVGAGSVDGNINFDPLVQNQRPGLLLLNGTLYIAFGSVGDIANFHGWVFAYNAATLQQNAVLCTTPNGEGGGIWQGGQGLASDGRSIFLAAGDGTFDANAGGNDYGVTFLRLNPDLSVADFFAPSDQTGLDPEAKNNVDLGSAGLLGLPGTTLMAGIGKDGILRLVDGANMGQYSPAANADVQEFPAVDISGGAFMGAPVYWNGSSFGPAIYVWGPGDYLKAYAFAGTFQTAPVSQSAFQGEPGYSNSVPLSISANGGARGSGIVWAAGPAPSAGNANEQTVGGVLRAFDASDLSVELWNSLQNPADDLGSYAKFNPPVVANGKVYVATFSGELAVYGMR